MSEQEKFDEYDLDLDKLHENDLAHELTIQHVYGPDAIHITNLFSATDAVAAKRAVKVIKSAFIGKAFTGDGSVEDPSGIGVYVTDQEDIASIWKKLNEK